MSSSASVLFAVLDKLDRALAVYGRWCCKIHLHSYHFVHYLGRGLQLECRRCGHVSKPAPEDND